MRLAQSVPTTPFFIHLEVIMQFPRSEAEIAKLTVAVAQGLEDAAQDFPAPPVPPAELRAKLDAVNAASTAAIAAESAFREHHALKDDVLEDLADSLKANLKYAEYAVRDEPTKLGRLGWGTRRDGTPLSSTARNDFPDSGSPYIMVTVSSQRT